MSNNKIDSSAQQGSLVTVYMPTYNRRELLQRAVESVLRQSYQYIELIVVDDGSTDGTIEYLDEISNEDKRVRYFFNEINSGACVSRNKAIWSAQGDFITGLDDDDYFMPEHIASFMTAWQSKQPDTIALYADIYSKKASLPEKARAKIKTCSAKALICANWIGNQVFTKTEYLKNVGGFDKDFLAWQDLECWYRLLSSYGKKAESTGQYTYVVDISHPHERISTKKIKNIVESCARLAQKHNLTANQASVLSLQLKLYDDSFPNLFFLLKKVFFLPTVYNFRHAIVILAKSVLSSIKMIRFFSRARS